MTLQEAARAVKQESRERLSMAVSSVHDYFVILILKSPLSFQLYLFLWGGVSTR